MSVISNVRPDNVSIYFGPHNKMPDPAVVAYAASWAAERGAYGTAAALMSLAAALDLETQDGHLMRAVAVPLIGVTRDERPREDLCEHGFIADGQACGEYGCTQPKQPRTDQAVCPAHGAHPHTRGDVNVLCLDCPKCRPTAATHAFEAHDGPLPDDGTPACDRTDLPEEADMRCAGCGNEAGEHAAWPANRYR